MDKVVTDGVNINSAITGIDCENAELPSLLPLVHMTTVGKFRKILEKGVIDPNRSETLNEVVSYLHYGIPVYRYDGDKNKEEDFPVAVMFQPPLLEKSKSFLPYDSGAVRLKLYHKDWIKRLANFPIYRGDLSGSNGSEIIKKFIYRFYQDNKQYLKGACVLDCSKEQEPLSDLCRFYKVIDEADARRAAIELHYDKPIPLDGLVVWVAVPDSYEIEIITKLRNIVNDRGMFHVCAYDAVVFDGTHNHCVGITRDARRFIDTVASIHN